MAELDLTQLRDWASDWHGMMSEAARREGALILADAAESLLDEIDRLTREHAELVERFLAWPHEDWCCAKGCTAPIGCHGCAGDCRCVRASVVAGLALPEERTP